jgi:hypothetical protein
LDLHGELKLYGEEDGAGSSTNPHPYLAFKDFLPTAFLGEPDQRGRTMRRREVNLLLLLMDSKSKWRWSQEKKLFSPSLSESKTLAEFPRRSPV